MGECSWSGHGVQIPIGLVGCAHVACRLTMMDLSWCPTACLWWWQDMVPSESFEHVKQVRRQGGCRDDLPTCLHYPTALLSPTRPEG